MWDLHSGQRSGKTGGQGFFAVVLGDITANLYYLGSNYAAAVQGELDRVSQTLTGRIRQLADRYATPLPQLVDEVAALAAKVATHLKRMGGKS